MAPSANAAFRVLVIAALATVALCAVLPDLTAVKATPKGNAAWMYVGTQQHINDWQAQLKNYNQAAGPERAIRIIYVYSMDLDYTIKKPTIGALTVTAAKAFKTIPYVTHVAAVVDGVLSDTANLNKLTTAQIQSLADAYARLYCSTAELDGVQLDLEPYGPTYKTSVLTFVKRLSRNFRDTDFCPKPAYGKHLSFFVGPRQADADLYNALGPNGYAVISGYDLSSPGPGLPETPQQYRTNLLSNVVFTIQQAATSVYGKYSIGLPFAASACEFESGISTSGSQAAIKGFPAYSSTAPNNSYIPNAFDVLASKLGATSSGLASPFLGVSVWAWLSRDVVVSGYRHTPKNAFDTPGMVAYLVASMPKKAVMPLA